jgi:hypothetical protein
MTKKYGFPKGIIGKNHHIKIQHIEIGDKEKSGQ